MTKTITTPWKGGTRQLELHDPGERKRMHQFAHAPDPLVMDPETLAWINATLTMGTELNRAEVEAMYYNDGANLLSTVINYWCELAETDDTEKGAEQESIDFDLDDQGAVDLEDMR